MATAVSGRLAARRQAKENYREHGGSGSRFRQYQRLRMKFDQTPTRLHLQRSEEPYEDPSNPDLSFWWKTGMGYFLKTKKYKKGIFIEKNFDEDLIDAYSNPARHELQQAEGVADGKWLKKFPPKPYYCVSGWIEEWFHLVSYEDERDGKTVNWTERERCSAKGCSLCKEGWARVFGNRFWFDFSYAQWFGPVDAVFEKLERMPKDGGYVYPQHYECEECNEIMAFFDRKRKEDVVLDMMNKCGACGSENLGIEPEEHMGECQDCDSRWALLSHEDPHLGGYLAQILKCAGCGHEGYPRPVMVHSEGLEEWECHDIYDVQLTIHKTDEKRPKIVIKKFEVKEPDPRLFDSELQGEGEAAERQAEAHVKCIDLNKVHPQPTPDDVAELIELQNLFDPNREARAGVQPKRWKPRHEREDGEGQEEQTASE